MLINDILDLSKIEAGKMEAHISSTDLAATLHEAASMLQPEAGTKGIALTEECSLSDTRGMVDPGMFREVIINLLSNAVKFTPEGGEVAVRAWKEESDLATKMPKKTEEMKNILLKLWADIKAEGPNEWWESDRQPLKRGGKINY